MIYDNTILGRCCAAYESRFDLLGPFDDEIPLCVAAVLDHLAGELQVLNRQEPRLSVHELAQLLIREAATVEPEPIEPPETWNTHPSLTAEERNR
jgi:hypothetical protein